MRGRTERYVSTHMCIHMHICTHTRAHPHPLRQHWRTKEKAARRLSPDRRAGHHRRLACGAVRRGDGRCLQRSWLRWWLLLEPYAAGVLPSAIGLGCFAVSLGASGVALAQLPGVSRLWYMPALQTVRGVCNLDGQRRSDALQSARSTFALCAALHLLAEAVVRTLPWSVRAWRRMAADVAVVASLAWALPLVLVLGLLLMAEDAAVLGLRRVRPEFVGPICAGAAVHVACSVLRHLPSCRARLGTVFGGSRCMPYTCRAGSVAPGA